MIEGRGVDWPCVVCSWLQSREIKPCK